MRTAQEIKASIALKLEALCKEMNEAQEAGLKVEFQLGFDASGRNAVVRYDVWQKVSSQ